VATPANSTGCASGQYVAGEAISLGASPAGGWQVNSWSGTADDSTTATTNSLTMPANAHAVSVTYREIPPICYALTRGHSGSGSDPIATPTNSTGCSSGQYVAGEAISLTADPDDGWQVSGWSGTADNSSTATTNALTMPANNHTVSVAYSEIPPTCYTLSRTHSGSGGDPVASPANSAGCASGQYLAGEAINLSADPDDGWRVTGWNGTANNVSTATTNSLTMPASNHTVGVVYGEMPPTCYTLTRSHTGSGSDPVATPANSTGCSSGQYVFGEAINLSASPDAGWQVSGWSGTAGNSSTAATNSLTMPASNHTVNVAYSEIPDICYALTRSHTGSGSDPVAAPTNSTGCASGQYVAGEAIRLSASPAAGWQVSSWSGTANNARTATTNSLIMPASNHTMSVAYSEIPPTCFALTRTHSGSGSDPVATPANSTGCAGGQYLAGEAISLSASPATGWRVSSWSGTADNSGTATTNSLTMPANAHVVSVTYRKIPPTCYTLSHTHSGVGGDPVAVPASSIGCSSGQYVAGEAISLSASPAAGWHVNGWSGTANNSSMATTNSLTMPASAHIVNVAYSETPPTCYALTRTHSGSGSDPIATPDNSTSCSSGQYVAGEAISLTADPDDGWQVSGWSGTADNSSTATTNALTMPANNHTVSVAYSEISPICFALSISHTGSGSDPMAAPANSVGCDLGQYVAGESITLSVDPDDGWQVNEWIGTANNGSTAATNSLTMPAGNHTVSVAYGELPRLIDLLNEVFLPLVLR
jgi:hypothetical protein